MRGLSRRGDGVVRVEVGGRGDVKKGLLFRDVCGF